MARKKSRYSLIAGIAVGVVALAGLAMVAIANHADPIQPFASHGSPTGKRVFVALENSEWKLALAKELVEAFRAEADFTVDNLSALSALKPAEWDAVVVVASIKAGSLQGDARAFLRANPGQERIVAVATSGSGRSGLPGTDAIAAASDHTGPALEAVGRRLEKLLKP